MYGPLILIISAFILLSIYIVSRRMDLSRYGLEVGPVYIMLKTERTLKLLDRMIAASRRFWIVYGRIGEYVGIPLSLSAMVFLSWNLVNFLVPEGEPSPILPFLPGVTVDVELFLYLLIPVAIAMVVHEAAHGVIMKMEDIPVRSAGILLALLILGAFVEPDEESYKRADRRVRRRILGAGSLANLLLGVASILVYSTLFSAPEGLIVAEVEPNSPLNGLGVDRWTVIRSVDGVKIASIQEFLEYLRGKIDTYVTIYTSTGSYTVKVSRDLSYGIGVRLYAQPYRRLLSLDIVQLNFYTNMLLTGMFVINISVALFNMLPLYPLDGEGYFLSFLNVGESVRRILRISMNVCMVILLASNIGLTVTRIGYLMTVKP
ncbi:MAG: site-2 protease family protein [Nitrososphaerota archaeon]|nr:site-2 protease family protein [Candidatus Bathyarchaeota archaeon]MDW8062298.1 site-2 protease family protein [Nitrososphaerota archaeon]